MLLFASLLALAATQVGAPPRLSAAEAAFQAQNAAVMDRMMSGMSAPPAGDIDADFVNMMEPHHRGAIEMAMLELRFGTSEPLKRIAQEIIVDQEQEIAAMRLALGRPLPATAPVPTAKPSAPAAATPPAPIPVGRALKDDLQ